MFMRRVGVRIAVRSVGADHLDDIEPDHANRRGEHRRMDGRRLRLTRGPSETVSKPAHLSRRVAQKRRIAIHRQVEYSVGRRPPGSIGDSMNAVSTRFPTITATAVFESVPSASK
jgi:hypothetical protein